MIKLKHICDNCKQVVGEQLKVSKETMETFLIPIANQEWCPKCVMTNLPNTFNFPDKSEFYGIKD